VTEDQRLGQRLQTLINDVGMTQTALGQLIGVKQGYINQIFRGHKRISATAIFAIAKRFTDLNLHWLLRGDGEMWMPAPAYPTTVVQAAPDVVEECPGRYDVPESNLSAVVEDHERRLQALEQKK